MIFLKLGQKLFAYTNLGHTVTKDPFMPTTTYALSKLNVNSYLKKVWPMIELS